MLMVFVPVVCNVDSAAKPDVSMAVYISNKFFQGGDATGTANKSTVQTDTQHFRCGFALGI
jgi:hypothetical protein